MNVEEQLTNDVYEAQCDLARIRGEDPPPFNRAFKDAVMDVFLDKDMTPKKLGGDQRAAEHFIDMVRRCQP